MRAGRFAWLVLLLACVSPARAAEAYDVYAADIAPWGFGKTQTGITPEFFRFLAAETGVALNVEVLPTKRVIDGLRDGDNALAMIAPVPDRDLMGFPICEPALMRTTIAYRKADAPASPTINWLADRVVAELRGSHTLDRLQDLVTYRNVLIDTQAQGVEMVAARRIDATVCLHPGCVSAMVASGLDPASFGELAFSAGPMAIYVSRASKLAEDLAAVDKLRRACDSQRGKEKMAELLKRWD